MVGEDKWIQSFGGTGEGEGGVCVHHPMGAIGHAMRRCSGRRQKQPAESDGVGVRFRDGVGVRVRSARTLIAGAVSGKRLRGKGESVEGELFRSSAGFVGETAIKAPGHLTSDRISTLPNLASTADDGW